MFQPSRFLTAILMAATEIAMAGCGDNPTSLTSPEAAQPAGASAVAATLSFTRVSVGGYHTCGLSSGGGIYCWGNNEYGQLGDGTHSHRTVPTLVSGGGLVFVEVSAGANHTCGLTTQNRVYCWGNNEGGRLGDGTVLDRAVPTAVGGGRRFVGVRAGTLHTCAVNQFNAGFCWGTARFGELGTDPTTQHTLPARVLGGHAFRRVVAGGGFTCGVTTADKAYCWGYNLDAELGDGTYRNRSKPVPVSGGLSFRQVVAGGGDISDAQGNEVDPGHACGVTTDRRAYCWGYSSSGQLGNGVRDGGVTSPVAVGGGLLWNQVIPGLNHTCGVTTTNLAYCWGLNGSGELGISGGPGPGVALPTRVAGGLRFSGVSTGPAGSHTCGITTENRIYCWGYNAFGQLGDGTLTNRSTPVKVVGQP
jgi:alpha-tubulin suppressor-like RCC1 family protein